MSAGSCFQRGGLRGLGRRIDLIECFAFRLDICSCVQVGSVQSSMSEPISDDGHVDARGNQLDSTLCLNVCGPTRFSQVTEAL